jgi:hypothetical protein
MRLRTTVRLISVRRGDGHGTCATLSASPMPVEHRPQRSCLIDRKALYRTVEEGDGATRQFRPGLDDQLCRQSDPSHLLDRRLAPVARKSRHLFNQQRQALVRLRTSSKMLLASPHPAAAPPSAANARQSGPRNPFPYLALGIGIVDKVFFREVSL